MGRPYATLLKVEQGGLPTLKRSRAEVGVGMRKAAHGAD
jgi:hypothetical protein